VTYSSWWAAILLGKFAKLQKATISFAKFEYLSGCLHGTTQLQKSGYIKLLVVNVVILCAESI